MGLPYTAIGTSVKINKALSNGTVCMLYTGGRDYPITGSRGTRSYSGVSGGELSVRYLVNGKGKWHTLQPGDRLTGLSAPIDM